MKFPPWTSVSEAARLLKEGEVVAIPTETVYGLAGNAFEPKALAKIFAAKERPTFDPLIVHIADIDQLADIAKDIPDEAYKLAEAYWPGPMTIILPKKDCIPDLCTSGLPSVAVRFPSHPVAQAIIKESGLPLAAPSANLFKHVSPTTAEHVAAQLADRIAGIVDGGACSVGVESSIISLAGETPTVLRPGAITPEMFSKVIGNVTVKESTSKPGQAMQAPGQCDTHYRPQVPLYFGEIPEGYKLPARTVRIAFGKQAGAIPATVNLSESGDMTEATSKLYAYMHDLDKPEYDLILVDPIPNTGVGMALNDRLKRASVKVLP
ncbi:MAG: threonylcarbamoyl-AMP synthase [Fibrobacter sp.]|jgi:L-threonylcarbamoyladenylate synthase|uniref:L-threonylcarbamoyladenylate synthase n=1 Tax=uncultured Fibrobacter sp. TaxID=261512 RepID=UPI001567439F|nr:L-threonylcarbamoyladenylate synthase [uncultured Fibrobacter sp.]MBQ1824682.1 threonylcarbamoyl-AMP synthase [Fibrobacter sp.]